MRAMVLERFGEPLQLREVSLPQLGADEVLVRVTACGLCGTDLKISAGKLAGTPLPLIMGHEPAGEVVEIGSAVGNVQVGDQVAAHGAYAIHLAIKNKTGGGVDPHAGHGH